MLITLVFIADLLRFNIAFLTVAQKELKGVVDLMLDICFARINMFLCPSQKVVFINLLQKSKPYFSNHVNFFYYQ